MGSSLDDAVDTGKSGDWPRASELFAALEESESGNWKFWQQWAKCHRNLGRHDQALACYERALALEPSAVLWWGVATTHDERGDKVKALEALDESLALDPSFTFSLEDKGALVLPDDPALAETLFRRAIAEQPAKASSQFNVGLACARQGKLAAAIEAFEAALALDPERERFRSRLRQAHRDQATAALEAKDYQAALAHFERTFELWRGDDFVAIGILESLIGLGRHDDAARFADEHDDSFGGDPDWDRLRANARQLASGLGEEDALIAWMRDALGRAGRKKRAKTGPLLVVLDVEPSGSTASCNLVIQVAPADIDAAQPSYAGKDDVLFEAHANVPRIDSAERMRGIAGRALRGLKSIKHRPLYVQQQIHDSHCEFCVAVD